MPWVVDRFEENMAVLEDTESLESIICLIADLPKGLREGDVLIRDGVHFLLDSEETAVRSRRIREKMERLKKR